MIQRASYGVPHITARNFASLGFGTGYVQAEDNICLIAEQMVTVRAERSRWLGAEASNVSSDLLHQKAIDDQAAEQLLDGPRDGVRAPSTQVRDQIRGFVAGYNAYLRDGKAITDPACAGKEWVRPISELDMWRAHWARMVLASSGALANGIVAAAPPTASGNSGLASAPQTAAVAAGVDGAPAGLGSNAYGLGREATTSGAGMLLANPHFPWDGVERFYRMHLSRCPAGMTSRARRWLVTRLSRSATTARSPGATPSPPPSGLSGTGWTWCSYHYDGQPREDDRPYGHRSDSRGADQPHPLRHPLRSGRRGARSVRLDRHHGDAITDANATNNRALDGWLAMGQARSVGELRTVLDERQFLSWVNVIAVDRRGQALYADHSVVPRVTDSLAAACIPE